MANTIPANIDQNTSGTDQSYYDNTNKWGENQYITLENVIDNIIALADDDSYLKHLNFHRAEIIAKQGLKKLKVDIAQHNKAIAWQLAPHLTIPFPRYMTNWYRVSVKDEKCGKTFILNVNNNAIVSDYLQDNNYELLYDDNGMILEGKSYNTEHGDCDITAISLCSPASDCEYNDNYNPYEDSWVRENKEHNYFEFSPDLEDSIIIIEFQANSIGNMASCDIKIHNDLEMVLTAYIKWRAVYDKRNISIQKIREYRDDYILEKKRAKNLLSPKISLNQIIKSVHQHRY